MDFMEKSVRFREPPPTRGERGRRNLPQNFWSSGTGLHIRSDHFPPTDFFVAFLISCLALSQALACTLVLRAESQGRFRVAGLVHFSQLGLVWPWNWNPNGLGE
jgi:hypothetical protein